MEEKMIAKGELITILQKELKQTSIATLANQLIQQQQYKTKNFSLRCLQRQIILNLIIYVIYREGPDRVEMSETALLQCQIKRWFALLPAGRTKGKEFNNSSHYFLTQLLLLSQVIHKIIQKLRLASSNINPQTIFITVVYLSTDKLVSPYCFDLIHRRLQKHQLPNTKAKKNEEGRSICSLSKKGISIAQFQEEVKSVLNPSKKEGQAVIKKAHSVHILFNNYHNKANREHSRLFKQLKENTEPNLQSTNKLKKSSSSQNLNRLSQKQSNCRMRFKWSKCELLNTEYIPFYVHQAAARQVRQKTATNYLNYRVSKERLTINTEKPRVLLKA